MAKAPKELHDLLDELAPYLVGQDTKKVKEAVERVICYQIPASFLVPLCRIDFSQTTDEVIKRYSGSINTVTQTAAGMGLIKLRQQ